MLEEATQYTITSIRAWWRFETTLIKAIRKKSELGQHRLTKKFLELQPQIIRAYKDTDPEQLSKMNKFLTECVATLNEIASASII